jgi:hypothetical protein
MAFLTREQILSADDLVTEVVKVPEWGGSVNVRTLTAHERDVFEESLLKTKGRGRNQTRDVQLADARAKLCAITILDGDGKQLFNQTDIAELGKKSAGALNRVYDVAARLSGLSSEDMDDLVGNSETAPDESTPRQRGRDARIDARNPFV